MARLLKSATTVDQQIALLRSRARTRTRSSTPIRNTCAHHGRLWNRLFTPAPTATLKILPQLSQVPDGQSARIYGALLVMAQILRVTSPGTTWPEKVRAPITGTFRGNPLVTDSALGLPANLDL